MMMRVNNFFYFLGFPSLFRFSVPLQYSTGAGTVPVPYHAILFADTVIIHLVLGLFVNYVTYAPV